MTIVNPPVTWLIHITLNVLHIASYNKLQLGKTTRYEQDFAGRLRF